MIGGKWPLLLVTTGVIVDCRSASHDLGQMIHARVWRDHRRRDRFGGPEFVIWGVLPVIGVVVLIGVVIGVVVLIGLPDVFGVGVTVLLGSIVTPVAGKWITVPGVATGVVVLIGLPVVFGVVVTVLLGAARHRW